MTQESSPFWEPSLALFHFDFCCTARPCSSKLVCMCHLLPSRTPGCFKLGAVGEWDCVQNSRGLGFCQSDWEAGGPGRQEWWARTIQNEVERFLERIYTVLSCIICISLGCHLRTEVWDVFCAVSVIWLVTMCRSQSNSSQLFMLGESLRLETFDRVISSEVTLWKGHWTSVCRYSTNSGHGIWFFRLRFAECCIRNWGKRILCPGFVTIWSQGLFKLPWWIRARVFLKPTTLQSWAQVSESYRDTGPARCDGGGCELSIRARIWHCSTASPEILARQWRKDDLPFRVALNIHENATVHLAAWALATSCRNSECQGTSFKVAMLRPMVLQTWLVTLPLRQILFPFLRRGWVIWPRKCQIPQTCILMSLYTVYIV